IMHFRPCSQAKVVFLFVFSSDKLNLSMPRSPPAADSYQQGCIRMTLENADLWKSFHSIGTEMIITKHGRRMFPHCSVSISGLQPFANYVIMMDMVPVDSFKYKVNAYEQWEVAGKAEPQPPCRTYMHPDSPAPGSHWMKQSFSFLKMKLTNNTLDQHGHIILHSMHRYYPRFHVIQADSPYTVRWGPFQTFSFPETTFTAVTAYQNPKVQIRTLHHYARFPFPSSEVDGTHTLGHPPPFPLATAEQSAQQHGYHHPHHHQGNTADWSQYPLFSYSCW
uniref:T-box domain-containing protein n=1 Tax=Anabas testudineus TaxID=64144 RepID=A0A3Q1KAD5_ANATE